MLVRRWIKGTSKGNHHAEADRSRICHARWNHAGARRRRRGPDGGFTHGGWTRSYWHDDIGATFGALMQDVDAFLLGRRTYVTHAQAFEPLPPGDFFGDMMNTPAKYVVSKTL